MANRKRWLIGCGLGCGLSIVAVVVTLVSFGIWVTRPGELLEPRALTGDDTTGYVEWTLRLEDPGTEGFVRLAIETVRELNRHTDEQLPPFFRDWLGSRREREAERDILRMFPMVAVWTCHPGQAEAEDSHLLSFSLKQIGNRLVFADWMLGWVTRFADDFDAWKYRGERFYRVPGTDEPYTFFLRGNDAFFTTNAQAARTAIDRLHGEAPQAEMRIGLDELIARVPSDATLRGALSNGRGELSRHWSFLTGDAGDAGDVLNRFEAAWLGGGLTPEGNLSLAIVLLAPDADTAAELSEPIHGLLEQELPNLPFTVEFGVTTEGRGVRVELLARDLLENLERSGFELETE